MDTTPPRDRAATPPDADRGRWMLVYGVATAAAAAAGALFGLALTG